MKKKVLIIGISGQDGSYLSKYLLKKKFIVHGISRKKKGWSKNLKILNIFNKVKIYKENNNYKNLNKILKKNYFHIFFLGGQSSVVKSFDNLEIETFDASITPLKIILEFIRNQKLKKTKLMFAASSEMYGDHKKKKINENSPKKPISPYGLSKYIGYEIVKSYREMFDLPVYSIIFFNHESFLRGNEFVFKKISNFLKNKKYKKMEKLELGNLNVVRDWGWAPEYMRIVSKIMLRNKIEDYIVATGKSTTLKKVIKLFFSKYNLNYSDHIQINKKNFRKMEVKENYANISKIKKNFNIKPINTYKNLVDLI